MDGWRGMLVMPVESGWIIKRWAADLTSRSFRYADATNASLRKPAESQITRRLHANDRGAH